MSQHDFKPASLFYKRPSKSASIVYNGCGCLVILMFLTAIALPSFLNKAYKATNSEAKQYVGSMNKGQQAKFAENGAWGTSVDALGLGIKTETSNYKYSIRSTKQAVFNYGISKHKKLPSYFGAVFLVAAKEIDPNAERNLITTVAILCETETRPLITFKPADKPAEPSYQNGEVICGKGTTNQFASPSKLFLIMEYPSKKKLASYVSAVFLVTDGDAMTTSSILCEADDRGTIKPAEPIYQNGTVICGKGTTQLTK